MYQEGRVNKNTEQTSTSHVSNHRDNIQECNQITHSINKLEFAKKIALNIIPFYSTYKAYKQEGAESAINFAVSDAALLVPVIGIPYKIALAVKSALNTSSKNEVTVNIKAIMRFVKAFLDITNAGWHQLHKHDQETLVDALARREYNQMILIYLLQESQIFSDRSFLEKLSGTFGTRLRGITDFMAEKVTFNADDPVLISTANKFTAVLDDIIIVLRDIHVEEQSIVETPEQLTDINELTEEEIEMIVMLGIEKSILE